jgi:hypothetical protein
MRTKLWLESLSKLVACIMLCMMEEMASRCARKMRILCVSAVTDRRCL